MREIDCDVAVIGAGTAGIAAHRAALKAGAKSLLIERGPGGTVCARVGCMPSKALISAASAAHAIREAGRFGVEAGSIRVDGRRVMERVRRLRDRFVASVFEGLDELPTESRLTGNAVFEGPDRLRVDDSTRVRFRAAVIATGSSPSVPEPLRDLGERLLTTDTLFEIPDLPDSLAVLGAGAVGIELAQAMARLGVETHLFDHANAIGGLSDPDLAAAAREIFGAEMTLQLGTKVERGAREGEGVRLAYGRDDGPGGSLSAARVLAAAGRPPNLQGIGLDRTGMRLDEKGAPVFDRSSLACEGAPILIAGDASADRPILHEASRQGGIAGRNAAALVQGRVLERPDLPVALAMVFTHPQIALVGAAYDGDVKGRLTGRMSFEDQGRARVEGRNQGGMRLYADADGRLVGAEMIGPDVEHLAHILAFAVADRHTAQTLRQRPFYHPTVEEGLQTALSDLVQQIEG